MNRNGMKCVIYVRVSTEMQVDGYSLDGQKNILTKYAEREGIEIVDIYEDAGKSGKSIEGRPAFQKMLFDIEKGLQINYILVYKLSRFGRNAADILNSLELIQDYDVNLISVEEGLDSSQATGKILISILSTMAEMERENIIEQTMNGRKEKARQGGWNGGFAPYGYKLENGKMLVCEDEAAAVRLIFDLYANKGYGLERIAKELNLRGIKKVQRENSNTDRWGRTIIGNILNNPIYIGKIAYGRHVKEKVKGTKNTYRRITSKNYIMVDSNHESIIDEATWNIVQTKREKYRKNFEQFVGKERVHLLSGILRCPKCGGPMYTSKYSRTSSKGIYIEKYFYECSFHKSARSYYCDCNLMLPKPKIEPYVVELIKRYISKPEFVDYVNEYISKKTNTSELETEKEIYVSKLKEITENKNHVEYKIDHMPLDEKFRERKLEDLNKRLDELYDNLDDVETRINGIEIKLKSAEYGKLTKERIIEGIQNFGTLYDSMTDEEKKDAIKGLIDSITLLEEPHGYNYIKEAHMKFSIDSEDHIDITIPGDILDDIGNLSKDYADNTYVKIQVATPVKEPKVTYKRIIEYIKNTYNISVSSNNIAEVKRMYHLENPNKIYVEPKIPCTKEKSDAIINTFKFYGLIPTEK